MELQAAEADYKRYRLLQQSEYYAHPGPRARTILDQRAKEFSDKERHLKQKFTKCFNALLELPHLSTYASNLDPDADTKEAKRYMTEIKGWIAKLQPLVESVVEKATAEQEER